MAHHGQDLPDYLRKRMEELADDRPITEQLEERVNERLGATGKFPQGKIAEEDDGEIIYRVGSDGAKVIMEFGPKPVSWVGMDPQQAAELASSLIAHAREAAKVEGLPIRLDVTLGPQT